MNFNSFLMAIFTSGIRSANASTPQEKKQILNEMHTDCTMIEKWHASQCQEHERLARLGVVRRVRDTASLDSSGLLGNLVEKELDTIERENKA